jgi:hypothetical protein
MIDLYWTMDADLAFGPDGDLKDTSFDPYRSVFQECRTRCRSSHNDWATQPALGANLRRLLGKPNNKMTAEEGKANIISALSYAGFVPGKNVKIRYMPINRHTLLYQISVIISVSGTAQTRILQMMYLYDTTEGSLSVV